MLSAENLRLLVIVDMLLVWKMLVVANYTALLRIRRKVYATPEDYAINRMQPTQHQSDETIERARRAHRNDLENILPFIAVSALFAATAPAHAVLAGYLWAFLGLRVLYSVFYLRSLQPHRTIAFTLGALVLFGMSVHALLRVV